MTIRFYPEAALTTWDDIEVSAVNDHGDYIERCEPAEADYWSVYLRQTTGGATCIADVPTKGVAFRLAELIENISNRNNFEITIKVGNSIQIIKQPNS